MKKLKLILGIFIIMIILHQLITYTLPVKVGSFPDQYKYEITNPYQDDPQIDDDIKIEKLIAYIENNKFTRIPQPHYTFDSRKTFTIHFIAKSEPFISINLYHLVYYPDRSYIQFGSKTYKLSKDDIEFLNQLFSLPVPQSKE